MFDFPQTLMVSILFGALENVQVPGDLLFFSRALLLFCCSEHAPACVLVCVW